MVMGVFRYSIFEKEAAVAMESSEGWRRLFSPETKKATTSGRFSCTGRELEIEESYGGKKWPRASALYVGKVSSEMNSSNHGASQRWTAINAKLGG